jgi:hypothetical protein
MIDDVATLRQRLEQRAADQRARQETEAADLRARNRAAAAGMPLSQAIVDGLRAAGINPAWVRFTEAGHTLEGGRRTKDRDVPPIPGVHR